MKYERVFNIACALLTLGAVALFVKNAVDNPAEARRADLAAELSDLDTRADAGADKAQLWPFTEWQAAIHGNPKVWDGLVPPPKEERTTATISPAPGWDALLKGVKVLMSGRGDMIKIIYPGSAPDGDYVGVGAKINGCVLESFDRRTATFTHHWPPTNETRTQTVPRVLR